ncbi:MAG: signal peptidase I [Thermoprotei archaeon]|nr:signal peptidase I [TACK group archaeon]
MGLKRDIAELALLAAVIGGLYAAMVVYMGNAEPLMIVTTGSMEPKIEPGWIVVVKSVAASSIRPGDVIAYWSTNPQFKDPIVHQVIVVNHVNGQLSFVTWGIANPPQYPDNVTWPGYAQSLEPPTGIPQSRVIGEVIMIIPYVGRFLLFLRQPPVYATLLLLFVGLLAYDALTERRKEGSLPALS